MRRDAHAQAVKFGSQPKLASQPAFGLRITRHFNHIALVVRGCACSREPLRIDMQVARCAAHEAAAIADNSGNAMPAPDLHKGLGKAGMVDCHFLSLRKEEGYFRHRFQPLEQSSLALATTSAGCTR